MPKAQKPSSSNSLSSWLILVIVVLIVGVWALMHRVLISSDMGALSGEHSLHNARHVQKLLDETTNLLREVIAANMTIDAHTKRSIQAEGLAVQADLLQLQSDMGNLEGKYAQCIAQKHNVSLKLSSCIHSKTNSHDHETENTNTETQINVPLSSELPTTPVEDKRSENSANENPWLVIGIPTVARMHSEDYLLQSLEAIAKQLPSSESDLMYKNIVVLIVNVQGSGHTRYDEAKSIYSLERNPEKSFYFKFMELSPNEQLPDLKVGATALNDVGSPNKPGYRVRKQTRNIASVMLKSLEIRGKYYLFLEDDMKICPSGFLSIQYLLDKASRYHDNWLAIRASYGMNGIFMHYKDLPTFANYLIKHQIRRPPDHLVVEWYAGETPESKEYRGERANIGFRFNMFDHIGMISTLRSEKSGSFPRCYEYLYEPTVFKVEAFNPQECPRDDIWPCDVRHADNFRIDWGQLGRRQ